MTEGDGSRLENSDAADCYHLLRSQRVGRVAIPVEGEGPLVVPVNYVVDGRAIVFRSAAGTKVQLLDGRPISFQVDEIDPVSRSGWSVLVRGRAREVSHWDSDRLHLQPWLPGPKDHWIRLFPVVVTGRRLVPPEAPAPELSL